MSEFVSQTARALKDRLREIERQLAGVEQLQQEKRRLERALAALGERTAGPARAARSAGRRATGIGERIVAFVREHGDATVDEISDGLGEARQLVQRNTQSLASRARLQRTQRADGRTAFTAADSPPDAPEPAADEPESGSEDASPGDNAADGTSTPRSTTRRRAASATKRPARRARPAGGASKAPEPADAAPEDAAEPEANE